MGSPTKIDVRVQLEHLFDFCHLFGTPDFTKLKLCQTRVVAIVDELICYVLTEVGSEREL
jgi:hypothetical protein